MDSPWGLATTSRKPCAKPLMTAQNFHCIAQCPCQGHCVLARGPCRRPVKGRNREEGLGRAANRRHQPDRHLRRRRRPLPMKNMQPQIGTAPTSNRSALHSQELKDCTIFYLGCWIQVLKFCLRMAVVVTPTVNTARLPTLIRVATFIIAEVAPTVQTLAEMNVPTSLLT